MDIDRLHGGTSVSSDKLRSGSSAAMDIKEGDEGEGRGCDNSR